ncbi:hypothetical protein AB0G73_28540 [Streptomyces sp. NPDC020719]
MSHNQPGSYGPQPPAFGPPPYEAAAPPVRTTTRTRTAVLATALVVVL